VTELVHYEVERRIATITLDSPHNRNALSVQLVNELADHLDRARSDAGVRGVVLTGTGNTFCAGADLSGGTPMPSARQASFRDVLGGLWNFPKTVILKLNGHVRAGGTGMVAAADIVVAPTTATFGFSEVRIGVAPAVIAVLCLRRMPSRQESRYMVTGETFDAVKAMELGLVTVAVAPEEVDATTAQFLDAVRLTEPTAVAVTKKVMVDVPSLGVLDGLVHAEEISLRMFASEAASEGMRAFREKRPPRWALED